MKLGYFRFIGRLDVLLEYIKNVICCVFCFFVNLIVLSCLRVLFFFMSWFMFLFDIFFFVFVMGRMKIFFLGMFIVLVVLSVVLRRGMYVKMVFELEE